MALLSRHGHSHGRSSGKATKRIELTARAFAAVREMTCVVAGVEVPASMAEKMIIDGDGIETRVVVIWRTTEALYAKAILFRHTEDAILQSSDPARISLATGQEPSLDEEFAVMGAIAQLKKEYGLHY